MIETHRARPFGRLVLAWSEHAGHDCLRVLGLSAVLAQLDPVSLAARFAVFPAALLPAANAVPGLESVAGRFERDGDALCFFPRWPFVAGVDYAFVERSSQNGYGTAAMLRRPALDVAPTTEVLAIYPSAPVVPLNLLKIYVHFSAPMSEGYAARAVHVRRAGTNEAVEHVFLPNSLELWDPSRTRLTLLLDPGRIKRGLLPNRQLGYPLTAGVPVTVTVDALFRDATGQPLRVPAERRYEVAAAIRTRVDPSRWQLHLPAARTRDAIGIAFDRPLDRAMLDHALTLHDPGGAAVAGRGAVVATESAWRFVPEAEWVAGDYTLTIETRLEDLAGNSVARVFDRDLQRDEDTPLREDSVVTHFTVE